MRNALIVGFVLAVTAVNGWMNLRLWGQRQVAQVREIPAQFKTVEQQHGRQVIGRQKIFRPSRIIELARPPWSNIESDDYLQYARNLRGLGCPEKTVRDILVADIGHNFEERRREIWNDGEDPFWLTGDQMGDLHRQRGRHEHELKLAKWKLLQELLQFPVDEEVLELARKGNGMAGSVVRLLFGFLEREQFIRLYGAASYYTSQGAAIVNFTEGILLPSDYEQARKLREQMRQTLATMLGKDGLGELRLRFSLVKNEEIIPGAQHGFSVSGIELREIWKIKTEHVDLPTRLFVDLGFEDLSTDNKTPTQDEIEVKVAKYLGAERYGDFARGQESDFRDIYEFATGKGLRKEDAVAVFDARSKVAEELGKIDAATDLTPEENLLLRVALKTRVDATINRRFGKIIGAEYRKGEGRNWLDEIVAGVTTVQTEPAEESR